MAEIDLGLLKFVKKHANIPAPKICNKRAVPWGLQTLQLCLEIGVFLTGSDSISRTYPGELVFLDNYVCLALWHVLEALARV